MGKLFFCNSDSLSSVARIAAFAAGHAVATNNRALAEASMPVAQGIFSMIEKNGDNAAANTLLTQGIKELARRTSSNPVVAAAVSAVLAELKINVADGIFPTFDNSAIQGLTESFLNGVEAALAAAK